MNRSVEECNRRMLRARDAMDRTFAEPLCIARLARIAKVSEAHFIRTFRATFGEPPHRYLQRRRVERAMFLLRASDRPITDIVSTSASIAWEPSAERFATGWANRRRGSGGEGTCPPRMPIDGGAPAARTPEGPDIFQAIQQQLGLRLVPAKGPVDVLVIDHVERPSEN